MFMWFLLFSLTATLFFSIKLWRAFTFWKRKGIPYDVPVPFFGMLLDFFLNRKSFIESVDEIYRAHPNSRYVGFYKFSDPVLLIRDPELIKQLYVKDFDALPEHRPILPDGAEPLWTLNLASSKVDKWRDLRPTMSPAFSSSKMKVMFNMMEDCSRKFATYFKDQESDSLDVELKDIFTRYTNDVIASTTFGVKVDSLRDQDNEFYRMGKMFNAFDGEAIIKIFLYSVFTTPMKWLDVRIFPRKASSYFNSFFQQAIKDREENGDQRLDVLNLLLQARKNEQLNRKGKSLDISEEEIAAQAMIFFLGGFETVSTSLCFTVYELAVHPEIQDRLRQEVDKVWRAKDGKLTVDDISKMKFLDMVISESLRKNTPMIVVDRRTTKPYTIPSVNKNEKTLELEVGQEVLYSIWSLHWDEQYFPNPRKFDPERFSDENKHNIKPGTYVPFGIGPRNCIGSRFAMLEMKSLLVHLIRNFEIIPNEKTDIPLELLKDRITLVPKNGFHLTFKKRDII